MKVIIHPDYRYLEEFISRLPQLFEAEGTLLYRGRNVTKRYQVEGTDLVVKRYKHPNIIQRITYTFFKPSKTARAYHYAALLREKGIDTPHEVAYIECFKHGLFTTGYFVSLYYGYPPTSAQLDMEEFDTKFSHQEGNVAATFSADKAEQFNHAMADELAAFFVKLHTKGILHGDLNLSNILYQPNEKGGYHFSVIDTNRSLFKQPTREECLDNLKRTTHRRNVLIYLVTRYAELRGWEPQACIDYIVERLDRFERKNRAKLRFRRYVHSHKQKQP